MKRALMAAFIAVMCARPAYAFECAPLKDMLKHLLAERKVAWLSTAIDRHHRVHMFFVNPVTREWAQIGVDNDLNACLILDGYALELGA